MRWLIRLCIVLVVLWCAWWALASYGASTGAERLFASKAGDGWRATISQSGFPFRIQTRLQNLRLTDPATTTVVTLDQASVSAPTYWPGFVTLDLPQSPITLETPASDVMFEGADTQAGVRVTPGATLSLQEARIVSADWLLRIGDAVVVEAQDLNISAVQDAQDAQRYDIAISAEDLTPGPLLRSLIALPDDWPDTFESLLAEAAVTFDKPLDRFATEGTPPRARVVELHDMAISWGPVALTAQGIIQLSDTGQPDGEIEIQLSQWPRLLDLAESSGVLPAAVRRQSELMFRALGNLAGDPEDLDLTLTFAQGRMALGPIDLGPAPEFYLQ
ncbi:DUF2125 domain-containing protein [Sulfitobacter aestuariivivens]|uniref:DUF2125 domain-containing protein n=1 Tax=Sulfitobacter aestuariivivens TaxID=2766981 RepID=A0A927HE45_9RHOB|nr:DUF2125 domain-containing protein [Sulfitobacter aestuariivivens]MBD3664387.1 DUF2125 domain-containing protein [Sulfitobacter aestuariivivens]